MIDDVPSVFSFDDSRAEFSRKLAKAERASIFRRFRNAGGRGCAAGGARPSAPPARILARNPLVGAGCEGDEEPGWLSRAAGRFGL